MESLLLHTKLLSRKRDRLLPHAGLLLHGGPHHLPRSSAALRSFKGPVRNHAVDSRHRAIFLLHPGHHGAGRGDSQEVGAACGEPALFVERDVEALVATLPLQTQSALPVKAGLVVLNHNTA